MAARSSPGGFVVATVTDPGSFMATITHPTGNGYCRDRILRDRRPATTVPPSALVEDKEAFRKKDGRSRPD